MKKFILSIVALIICCVSLRAQEMNAYGVSFEQTKDQFESKFLGTYFEISFAVDIVEENGKVVSVTGLKELVTRADALIIYTDVLYSIELSEKYITKEERISTSHNRYIIGDNLGTVDVQVLGRFIKLTFKKNKDRE